MPLLDGCIRVVFVKRGNEWFSETNSEEKTSTALMDVSERLTQTSSAADAALAAVYYSFCHVAVPDYQSIRP